MNGATQEVLNALESNAPIERTAVLCWMADLDVETRALVYELTDKAWSRITPELSMEEQCAFMGSYLLQCIAMNRQDDERVHSGFEAAWEFASWLKHVSDFPSSQPVVARAVEELEQLYKSSDADTKNRIETGAVEHILEKPALRIYFGHWKDDPELKAAYEQCLEWGEAHPA